MSPERFGPRYMFDHMTPKDHQVVMVVDLFLALCAIVLKEEEEKHAGVPESQVHRELAGFVSRLQFRNDLARSRHFPVRKGRGGAVVSHAVAMYNRVFLDKMAPGLYNLDHEHYFLTEEEVMSRAKRLGLANTNTLEHMKKAARYSLEKMGFVSVH